MAVFLSAVLARSVPAPIPVFNWPVVLLRSDRKPTDVLKPPVVRLKRALCPSAVLPPGYPPSGAGLTACAPGESAKQASANNAIVGHIIFLIVFMCLFFLVWFVF